jgi:predicted ATP-dependent endonuclease of OLD family
MNGPPRMDNDVDLYIDIALAERAKLFLIIDGIDPETKKNDFRMFLNNPRLNKIRILYGRKGPLKRALLEFYNEVDKNNLVLDVRNKGLQMREVLKPRDLTDAEIIHFVKNKGKKKKKKKFSCSPGYVGFK